MNPESDETKDDLIIVARATRTRGLKGELIADLLTDFPDRFETTTHLLGRNLAGEVKQFELEDYWFQNDRIVLKFAGYDSIESAKVLVGYEFGVPETERVELSEGAFYDWELEGCAVEKQDGTTIGEVRGVVRTGGVEILAVKVDGQDDVLIPMASSIVVKVDVSEKRIVIDPPDGLLEL